jgi:regulatory protein
MLTVTKLEPQQKNPQRLNVYLNGEFAFGIFQALASRLEEGDQLNQDDINNLQFADQVELAYQRALNYLSYRDRSEQEIRLNLRKAKIEDDVIEEVLERLRGASLVNDQEFAKKWVENRSRFKPRGKRALSSELFQKGISQSIIDTTLENLDEKPLALRFARKKMSKLAGLEKPLFQKKMYGYLSRRGFTYDITKEIISQIWDELEVKS